MTNIQQQLANTLGISPDEILTYKPYPSGYAVLTTDMRKFTDVQPVHTAKPGDTALDKTIYPSAKQPGTTGKGDDAAAPPEVAMVANPPKGLRELQTVFDNPADHTVAELRELAHFLALPAPGKMRKADLIEAIEECKEAAVNS